MTNQTTEKEVLALMYKHLSTKEVDAVTREVGPYDITTPTFTMMQFCAALEERNLAQIAGLRDALKLAEYAMSSDGAEMPIAEWRKIEYEINCAMIDTQQTAEAFLADRDARVLEEAAKHLERASQHVGWHHAAKDWPMDAKQAIEIFGENQASELRSMAAEKHKQAGRPEGKEGGE